MVEDFIAEYPTINGPCLAVKDQQIRSPEWAMYKAFICACPSTNLEWNALPEHVYTCSYKDLQTSFYFR